MAAYGTARGLVLPAMLTTSAICDLLNQHQASRDKLPNGQKSDADVKLERAINLAYHIHAQFRELSNLLP